MSQHHTRWYIAASWMTLVLLTFVAVGASSGQALLLLTVVALVPPAVMMTLWKEPSLTIAEVLHATDAPR